MIGLVTSAIVKVQDMSLRRLKFTCIVRLPYMRIGVPFAANKLDVVGLRFLSVSFGGIIQRSLPVSIRNLDPDNWSIIMRRHEGDVTKHSSAADERSQSSFLVRAHNRASTFEL